MKKVAAILAVVAFIGYHVFISADTVVTQSKVAHYKQLQIASEL